MAKRAPKSKKSRPAPKAARKAAPKASPKAKSKSAAKVTAKATPKATLKAGPKGKAGAKPASKATSKPAPKRKAAPKARAPIAKPALRKPKPAPSATRQKPATPGVPTVDPTLAAPAGQDLAPVAVPNHPPRHTPSSDPKRRAQEESSRRFAIEVAQLCRDDKCTDVVLLDVRGLSSVSDYIVVGSGTSDRQMKSVLDHVAELGQKFGFTQSRTNSDDRSTWLLIDFVDVMVHLFEPTTRAHYDIEMLWGDAPRMEWERPDQIDRDRAGLSLTGARQR